MTFSVTCVPRRRYVTSVLQKVLERAVLHVSRERTRKSRLPGHAPEVGFGDRRRPSLRGEHTHISRVVDALVRKECPLHEIDQVRADVVQALTLLGRVEEPAGADVGYARDCLHQMMHALHVHAGLCRCALHRLSEHRRIAHQLTLQHVGNLEAFRHDVVGHEPPRVGLAQRGIEGRQVSRTQDPRLVREHVEAGPDGCEDLLDLAAVPPRDDDHVAGPRLEHPLEVVGARVHLELPRGRVFLACVVGGDASRGVPSDQDRAGRTRAPGARRRDTSSSARARRESAPGRAS